MSITPLNDAFHDRATLLELMKTMPHTTELQVAYMAIGAEVALNMLVTSPVPGSLIHNMIADLENIRTDLAYHFHGLD